MGYGDGVKGYRVWSPSEKRVVMSRNVVFDESSMFKVSAESISEADQEDVDKQVELQEVQSDYPGSTDPVSGSDRSTLDTGLGDGRDLRSMSDNTRSIDPQERAKDRRLMSSLNLLILEINVLGLKNAVLLKTDQEELMLGHQRDIGLKIWWVMHYRLQRKWTLTSCLLTEKPFQVMHLRNGLLQWEMRWNLMKRITHGIWSHYHLGEKL